MRLKNTTWHLISAFLIGTLANSALAATEPTASPKLVIIIDNLGDQQQPGIKVANLPGDVACSILPHGRYSAKIADLCHAQNKTVILNTPMQPQNNYPLGPGGLHANMSKQQFMQTLSNDMASVPHIQGLDNQMGSLLTSQEQPMSWVMEAIKPHGLFFLDNKTSPHSVAGRAAKNNQIPFISRDIFLDDVRTPEAVHKRFAEALKIAKRYGIVVIVAHPYRVTLDYLQATLPGLSAQGYQLVSIPKALNVSIEPVTLTAAKTPAPAVAKKTVVKNTSPEKPLIKPASRPTPTINIPEMSGAHSEPTIELTADKARRVIVNSVDQTTATKEVAKTSQVKTTQLNLPVHEKTIAPTITAPETPKPGLFSRLSEKISHLFSKDKKTEPAKPVAIAQANTTAIQPAPIKKQTAEKSPATPQPVAAKNTATAAQVTAKASHSLVQTFKDSLCQKYAHFCGHPKQADTVAHTELTNTPFIDLQGKLHWPTVGDVATRFGAELGETKLKYNGVLIQAPAGQQVHAIYRGRVIFANWLQGLGLLLIIDHGNGYMSLYGHNEALYKKVGDTVKPNDLIAAVGNSGAPGPTGLYFEIRHNGQPINPEQWCG